MTLLPKKDSVYTEKKDQRLSQSHARYKAYFFGPFRITLDDLALGETAWRRNKARSLLKWFLLNPSELFSIEQLGQLFWPDTSMEVAASSLHVTLHYLRHVLEPQLAPGRPSTFIRRNRHNYYWFDLNDLWWTDVFNIQSLSAAAKEAEHRREISKAIALYRRLISYYSQTFLPEDIYEDIFSPYRRQHDYAYAQLLEHLLQLYTLAHLFDDAFSCALRILAVNPYSEEAVKTMVHVYLHQGNVTGALRQLDNFRNSLNADLGIEPGQEILALRDSILDAR